MASGVSPDDAPLPGLVRNGSLQLPPKWTGQNTLSQVEIFNREVGLSGLIITKLDGTSRGGILVAVAEKFKLPVYFIGVGERIEDLDEFKSDDFAKGLLGI